MILIAVQTQNIFSNQYIYLIYYIKLNSDFLLGFIDIFINYTDMKRQ